jgi:hypothetical protein
MVARIGSKKERGSKSTFKYKSRGADDVKKRAEQSGGRFDSPFKSGFDVFRPKVGENLIRILPATWEDHDHYGLDVWMHRFIGGDNSNYLCLNKMNGKRCPACDEAKAAKAAGEDDEAKALQPVKRTLVWVLDRDDDSNTPLLWDMSWTQDRDIAALCYVKRTGKVLLLDHPDDGYDLTVKKTGQGLKTRYQFIVDREPSSIADSDKEQEKILEYITENPLPTVLRFDTPEHIEKALSGTAAAKDEDLDDEKPRRGKRDRDDEDEEEEKPRSRRRAEPEDEEEEKPRSRRRADPDEEEEEEKPRSRRRADPEEEEEEEKPRSRRRADPDEEEEEKPRGRARREEAEDEEEEKPRSRRGRDKEEEEEEEEKPRSRKRADPEEEEEEEEKPRRRARREEPEEEEEERPRRARR